MSETIKFSRSAQESFRRCRREYFYKYEKNGTGFEPSIPSLPLIIGTTIHLGMEWLFKVNVEEAIKHAWAEWEKLIEGRPQFPEGKPFASYGDFLDEQKMLIAGLIYAWRIQFYEQFIREYEVISVEREIETKVGEVPILVCFDGGGTFVADPEGSGNFCTCGWAREAHSKKMKPVILQSRCDMVVRSNLDGAIYIPDWKCVKDARDWHRKFQMESQTWAQMHAVGAHLGELVGGAIYWALIKGGRTKDGRQSSNLIYGYRKLLASGTYEYDPDYKSAKGWEKFEVWRVADFGPDPLTRLKYWLNWLPYEVRAANFCQSPPVGLNEELANDWLETSSRNMIDIKRAVGDTHKPDMQFFYRNNSYYTCSKCPYKDPCLEGANMDELIQIGQYRPRIDHHVMGEE